MTKFVPNSYPDFDTDSSGMHAAFRDRGGSHHGLVTYQTSPGGGVAKLTLPGGMSLDPVTAMRRGNRLTTGTPLMRSPTSVDGVTASINVVFRVVTRRGRLCYEIDMPEEAGAKNIIFPITNRVYSNKISMVCEFEDMSKFNGGGIRLGLYKNVGLSIGIRHMQTIGPSNAWTGVHVVAPNDTEWAAVSTGSFDDTQTHVAATFQRGAISPGPTRVWVYEIAEDVKNTLPSIIFGADDGHETWYSQGLPILEKYGLSCYNSYIEDSAAYGAMSMTKAQWQDTIKRGHYAVVHGCKEGIASLRAYFSDYTGYASPEAAIRADIAHNRDGMIAAGLDPDGRGRKFYVLPQGNFQPGNTSGDMTIENALRAEGFVGGRRNLYQNSLYADSGWGASMLYLPTVGHSYVAADEAANIAAIILRMQTDINAGRSVILCFHIVRDVPTAATDITPANLELICAAASALINAGKAKDGRLTDFVDELMTYSGMATI